MFGIHEIRMANKTARARTQNYQKKDFPDILNTGVIQYISDLHMSSLHGILQSIIDRRFL
jgi:hypothetical protein